MQPDLAYDKHSLARTTPVEHIFMGPKVFEPLKFYCIWSPEYGRSTIAIINVWTKLSEQRASTQSTRSIPINVSTACQ